MRSRPCATSTSRYREGEVFGFLGPNGAGKTTTVRMLCTLLPPTARQATVAGADVVADAERRPASGSASRSRRSGSTRCRPAASCSSSSAASTASRAPTASKRTDELLELVGLTDAADRRTKNYSGGMKRRLDLASALVHSPRGPLPRRADDGPRPGLAADRLGRGPPDQRHRHHDLPHHPVPRGGRRALRPPRDHRRRQDRRRGHARGPEGADRQRRRLGRTARRRPEGDRAGDRRPPGPRADGRRGRHARTSTSRTAPASIAEIVRKLDSATTQVGAISVARPSLDDVFLEATGRRLEGASPGEATEEWRRSADERGPVCSAAAPSAR